MAGDIKGSAEFDRKLKDWKTGILKVVAAGLTEWGERTIAVSADGGEGYSGNIVPVDTGRLLNSKRVGKPELRGQEVSITIGYHTDYAAAVHELDEANFKRPGSGSQFLREPAKHMGEKSKDIIGPYIADFLK